MHTIYTNTFLLDFFTTTYFWDLEKLEAWKLTGISFQALPANRTSKTTMNDTTVSSDSSTNFKDVTNGFRNARIFRCLLSIKGSHINRLYTLFRNHRSPNLQKVRPLLESEFNQIEELIDSKWK
jgi:hypothetical protein